MSEKSIKHTDKNIALTVSDKIAIINELMDQDREEVRDRQDSVLTLTYTVIPGLLAIAVLAHADKTLKWESIVGTILLFILYLVVFLIFRRWLADTRACQQIREEFYKHQELLHTDLFKPLRGIEPKDRKNALKDKSLWFPFGVTTATSLVILLYLILEIQPPK